MEFGPEIKVDGKRPEWLGSLDKIMVLNNEWRGGEVGGLQNLTDRSWPNIKAIRLSVDHPHYQQNTPTPDERAVAPELVARLVALAKDVALDEIVSRTALRTEARAIVAALEPVVDEDLVIAREICAEQAIATEYYGEDLSKNLASGFRRGSYDDGGQMRIALAALRHSRTTSRDVTPRTREQFEEDCRS